MKNGTSTGQGGYTTYGTRDVRETAEYSNWSELAGAKLAESSGLGRNSYTTRKIVCCCCRYLEQSAPTWSRPHPLCLFSEVASKLSSSGVSFHLNFCCDCAVTVVIF